MLLQLNTYAKIVGLLYDEWVENAVAGFLEKFEEGCHSMNLDKAIEHKALKETFSVFGSILSCKVATDASGKSKGYGFVQFEQEEAAQNAIEKLNGMCLNDKPVYVGPFLRRMERENTPDQAKFNNVFVKNLAESTSEDDLVKVFGDFGKITSLIVMRERDGKFKCFGFVNFENPDAAARAANELKTHAFQRVNTFMAALKALVEESGLILKKLDKKIEKPLLKSYRKHLPLMHLQGTMVQVQADLIDADVMSLLGTYNETLGLIQSSW
ncbi:Polyadenylate-binding protein 2 [Platanthera zijinensis]|uniref:Polyadenylate-binding protein 2 n=1 Tax=Platanthera zijinensis TaxID=2320716 RepID=A0AAP0C0V8_9ASPA